MSQEQDDQSFAILLSTDLVLEVQWGNHVHYIRNQASIVKTTPVRSRVPINHDEKFYSWWDSMLEYLYGINSTSNNVEHFYSIISRDFDKIVGLNYDYWLLSPYLVLMQEPNSSILLIYVVHPHFIIFQTW